MKPIIYSPPKALADAERDYLSALEYLLRCAVMVGKKESGAIVKAKRARQLYNTAVIEVRRSERQSGRTGSINWIHSQLGVAQHSANARGPGNIDYVDTVERALESLKNATW